MSEPRSVNRRRLPVAKLVVALSVALATYVAVECGFRLYVYRQYVEAGFPVTIVDADIHAPTTGYLTPNLDFHWRVFDATHKMIHVAHVKTNAQGFISSKDYPQAKLAGEFRIALIGDSFTACITNDFPWADVLEDELNRDEGFKKKVNADVVRVLNFGTPGAGFHFMACNYVRFAERFSPDMVVVNYIEDDFPREGNANLLENLDAMRDAREPAAPYAQVQDARIRVLGNYSDDLARLYGDPLRIPGLSLSSFFVVEDDAIALDKTKMDSIKSELAERYFSPRLWRSLQPHALYRLVGIKFRLEHSGKIFSTKNASVAPRVEHALEAFRAIQRRNPRMLVLRNPVHSDLTVAPDVRCTEPLEAALTDIEIVRMEKYLPVERGADDIYKWFNLPNDGHWSNYGAKLYAAAIHQALAERMPAATLDASPPPSTARPADDATQQRR